MYLQVPTELNLVVGDEVSISKRCRLQAGHLVADAMQHCNWYAQWLYRLCPLRQSVCVAGLAIYR